MDGVFYEETFETNGICLVLAASVWCGSLLADRQRLNDELIRFHVVANSDSEEDQSIKLQVRDAVLNSLQNDLNKIADVNEARAYLQASLPKIQANRQQRPGSDGVRLRGGGDAV